MRTIRSRSSRRQIHSRLLARFLSCPQSRRNGSLGMLPRRAVPHRLLLSVDSPGMLIHPELPLPRAALRQHLLRTGWGLQCHVPGIGTRGVRGSAILCKEIGRHLPRIGTRGARRLVTLRKAMDRRSSDPRRTSATIVSRVPPLPLPLTSFTRTRAGRNSGYENFDRSQTRTAKPKEKGLRKIFSWISRRQQLSTAHNPQPQTGLEDEDLQFQAAAQASLEGAQSQSFFEQMLWEQEAPLRRRHLDEITHLEDDQSYEPFSEARNTVEDEDEQLRLAIAESAEMAREQGYTQTITGNEWAKLKSAYTFFFFFLLSLVYRDL
jgi:hypothetical protein